MASTDAQSVGTEVEASTYDGSDGWTKIQNAIDDFGTDPCKAVVRGDGSDANNEWYGTSTINLPDNTVIELLGDAYVPQTGGQITTSSATLTTLPTDPLAMRISISISTHCPRSTGRRKN
ncbi:hypothetical protein [Halosimplex sp. TS25]|uniref:hypothetical protein n=1 Tax=Halosimplex rarum TaxID=3396619 RepID=UPI0039EC2077